MSLQSPLLIETQNREENFSFSFHFCSAPSSSLRYRSQIGETSSSPIGKRSVSLHLNLVLWNANADAVHKITCAHYLQHISNACDVQEPKQVTRCTFSPKLMFQWCCQVMMIRFKFQTENCWWEYGYNYRILCARACVCARALVTLTYILFTSWTFFSKRVLVQLPSALGSQHACWWWWQYTIHMNIPYEMKWSETNKTKTAHTQQYGRNVENVTEMG